MWTSPKRAEAHSAGAAPHVSPTAAPAATRPASAEAVLRRLEWTVIRRLDGLLQGDYRTLFRGAGLDLADLREYQHHDDVRYIDWNVTARLDVPYVREFTETREIAGWFLLDLSPSVDFGSRKVSKRELSRDFVTVLARLLTRHGNRIGAVLYGSGVEAVIPARSGRMQVLDLLHRLQTRAAPKRSQPTDLSVLFQGAREAIPRRSLVFVVSDFQSVPGWESTLGRLALRHEIIAVRLVDPLERELPDLGMITMQDAETGEQLLVDTHDRRFRKRFAEACERRQQALEAAFARAGVDVIELDTDEDLVDALLRFAELRRMRSRLASGATR